MIYLDSCLLIYLVEDTGPPSYAVRQRMNADAEQSFAISPLVVLECLVSPIRAANTLLKARYDRIFRTFVLLPAGLDVFEAAAELRAEHGLKTPDALHLAAALLGGCAALWTNDQRLASAAGSFAVAIG
jgi:predicted nucleic acid-binding protein